MALFMHYLSSIIFELTYYPVSRWIFILYNPDVNHVARQVIYYNLHIKMGIDFIYFMANRSLTVSLLFQIER
jgi:hypothetical protein